MCFNLYGQRFTLGHASDTGVSKDKRGRVRSKSKGHRSHFLAIKRANKIRRRRARKKSQE